MSLTDSTGVSDGETATFEVTYACNNCGHEFVRQYDAGIIVEMSVQNATQTPIVKDTNTFQGHQRPNCENCKTNKKLTIAERNPIIEDAE